MSLRYLPEHAENALLALELARKRLRTCNTPTERYLPCPLTQPGFSNWPHATN